MRKSNYICGFLLLSALSGCTPDHMDQTVPSTPEAAQTAASSETTAPSESVVLLDPDTLSESEQVQESRICITEPVFLTDLISPAQLATYFTDYTEATMLISDGESTVVLDEELAQLQFSPYSTFKIPNSLIALETGVITEEDSLRQWDKTVRSRPELNQDQTLASAFTHSCVWYYQELARQVGAEAMQTYLDQMEYGNHDISAGIDEFWLGESLKISPQEQLDFITRLYHYDLPFSRQNIDAVKAIMKQDGYPVELYGKTGSSGRGQGWFVGYALLADRPYFFSVYITGDNADGLTAREITADIMADIQLQIP